MTNQVAKEVTGWRIIKKSNGKMAEINTHHISPSSNLPFLKTAVTVSLAEILFTKWKDDLHGEVQKYTLYKIIFIPSKKVFYLYNNLPKWVSLLMIQAKTDKIGLKFFFNKRYISSIKDIECVYGKKKETVKHILTKYSLFSKMKRMFWKEEIRKTR